MLSSITPKYLTQVNWGTGSMLMKTGGNLSRRWEKVTCTDFVGSTFIFHLLSLVVKHLINYKNYLVYYIFLIQSKLK